MRTPDLPPSSMTLKPPDPPAAPPDLPAASSDLLCIQGLSPLSDPASSPLRPSLFCSDLPTADIPREKSLNLFNFNFSFGDSSCSSNIDLKVEIFSLESLTLPLYPMTHLSRSNKWLWLGHGQSKKYTSAPKAGPPTHAVSATSSQLAADEEVIKAAQEVLRRRLADAELVIPPDASTSVMKKAQRNHRQKMLWLSSSDAALDAADSLISSDASAAGADSVSGYVAILPSDHRHNSLDHDLPPDDLKGWDMVNRRSRLPPPRQVLQLLRSPRPLLSLLLMRKS
ncbi:hypothetical protein F2Q69_00016472 [Brassica cretica]|uniref:Uncharacterized protein n=1 Tax=Brassica cretica TaxID=69181 RepID=A0A8S9R629_BRACR|nr:hypothetical protein F2Q69_00016472 [Brassica cretica]